MHVVLRGLTCAAWNCPRASQGKLANLRIFPVFEGADIGKNPHCYLVALIRVVLLAVAPTELPFSPLGFSISQVQKPLEYTLAVRA